MLAYVWSFVTVEIVGSEGGEAWVFRSHRYVGIIPWRRRRILTSESFAERDLRREDSGEGVADNLGAMLPGLRKGR
jgi:hypothetical protein